MLEWYLYGVVTGMLLIISIRWLVRKLIKRKEVE